MDTPDGVKSGSAVQEIMRYDPIEAIKPVNLGTTEVLGDAVVILVNDVAYFITLTRCSDLLGSAIDIGTVQPPSAKAGGNSAEKLKAFQRQNGQALLDGSYYMKMPYAVLGLTYFADPKNFETIRSIDLSDSPGWSLEQVTISVTTAPITRQATQLLPWLPTLSRELVKNSKQNKGYMLSDLGALSDLFGKGR